jgi:indolepyruvate ferredoxin oxidoreductase beta subunit
MSHNGGTRNVFLSGVGGQGTILASNILGQVLLHAGYDVKKAEVHGMAQRGGAVTAHLRLADHPIESDLIPLGAASMILSLEPLESLRYLHYLAPDGAVITATQPVANIPDYPALDGLLDALSSLPRSVLVDAAGLARQAGLGKATNMVMAGAAAPRLPIALATIERSIEARFARKGRAVVDQNLAALRAGQEVGTCTAKR